jgi:hypothetical protein
VALREDQIQRFSRQILLREVGGVGQQRLLGAAVRVLAAGPAIDVAVAYLVAGGTPVELAEGVTIDGFLHGAPLDALSPDAHATLAPSWTLSTSEGPDAHVVIGAGVAWRDDPSCVECGVLVRQALQGTSPPVATGSLAALIAQRLVLGRDPKAGLLVWKDTQFAARELPRCPRH